MKVIKKRVITYELNIILIKFNKKQIKKTIYF